MITAPLRPLLAWIALLCAAGILSPETLRGAEAGADAEMLAGFRRDVATYTTALEKAPDSVALLSRRGDRYLFLGEPAKAVADFERTIALDPALDAPHWRLGIAYYFAGDYAKSAAQFAKYHAFDGRDRENGIWKFLAQAAAGSLEKARAEMLEYTRFDREPFPALYDMFAGKKTTDEMFAEIETKKLGKDGAVMFFAHYYGGLNEEILGRRERARELVGRAVESPWGRTAEGGPAYMWQCARLHAARLAAKAK